MTLFTTFFNINFRMFSFKLQILIVTIDLVLLCAFVFYRKIRTMIRLLKENESIEKRIEKQLVKMVKKKTNKKFFNF